MAKLQIVAGATSQTINIFIQDSSSTTGAGLTGLVYNSSGLVAYYALPKAAAVAISLATLAAITTAYSSGGFKEVDASNMPGWYRLDLPDAAIASGRFVSIHLKGATNMAPLPLEIELTATNNQSATAFITGVNSLAPPTNWNLTSIDGSGRLDISKMSGTSLTARDIGASVLLSTGTGTGQLDFTSGVVKGNMSQILGTALTETAGLLAGGFKQWFNVATPTGTINSIPNATAGASGGLFIAGSNAATTANITGNITGNLSGSVGSVTGAVGSVTGAVGSVTGAVGSVTGNVGGNVVGSVASVTARVTANSDQFAGQTITAASGVTLPATVASTTNITAGTITTATNLTNAPTAGDFTAAMKTSLNAATPASIPGAVGSVTGDVGGNVVGSVGSVIGAVGSVTAPVSIAAGQIYVKKNTSLANFVFPMFDSTTHQMVTGKAPTVVISIDGGLLTASTNVAVEVGGGYYRITFTAAEFNGTTIAVKFSATSCDDLPYTFITQA